MFAQIKQDARLYHEIRAPARKATLLSWAWLWLSSRGLKVIAGHRLAHHRVAAPPRRGTEAFFDPPIRLIANLAGLLSQFVAKCDVLPTTVMEEGVYLSDHGHIVLGARRIGSGTIIHDHVTIGMDLVKGRTPDIGRNVLIYSNCVIYGGITLGDGATVLSHTVLTRSVLPGVVVQGNPPRIVRRNFENAALRRSLGDEAGVAWGAPDLQRV